MRSVLHIGLLFLSLAAGAQTYDESKLVLISENGPQNPIEYYTRNAFMQLNLGNGDFVLNADLSDLRTGNARLDSLLQAQGDQPFVFKGNISENILTYSQQQNDEKNYTMQGQLTVNSVTLPCTAVFDPINLADKNEIKNYRMDLAMQIDPEKFPVKIPGVRFTKQIALEITAGRLNVQN